jgi:hypothetical protein
MTDFSKVKFRCHQIGGLMTNQQGKKDTTCMEEISEGTKDELIKVYVSEVYGRDKEINSKYIKKGLAVEEDSLTLISRVNHILLIKNDQRLQNDYITGEPDTLDPLYDAKSCWDIHTFYKNKAAKKLNKDYYWQMQGYADLLGKDFGTVAFCLIDTPTGLIEDEKNKLFYRMNVASKENPDYLEACIQLEKEMTFSDIPMEERIHEVKVKRSPEDIDKFYKRVPLLREWLNEFANKPVLA